MANTPRVDPNICKSLRNLGTPQAQEQLFDLASASTASTAIRRAAVEKPRQAVAERRILLMTADIQLQYDRCSASENLGEGNQQMLGAVLDILERPRGARK
jgi:hypothetical protein